MFINKLYYKLPRSIKNKIHFIKAIRAVIKYGYPAGDLEVIGVTGTDGKTTTSTMIYEILKEDGKKVALLSTVAAYIGNTELDTGFHVTTPDPELLQSILKKIKEKGFKYVVLETTSHALDQHRVFGANIRYAVLTNITHEHLDYHKTYENYVRAKSKIFAKAKVAVINKNDSSFQKVKKYIKPGTEILAYDDKSARGQVLEIINKTFPEDYNRMNATAAYLISRYLGCNDSSAMKAFKNFRGVPGRMEYIQNKKGLTIIVDFAHTPNALENVLTALKKRKGKSKSKLICVFGCASERDLEKRPLMGKISTSIADISVFTSEDPRNEDPDKIISEIVKGAEENNHPKKYFGIADRGEAIYKAINEMASPGDTVVVCGKGHEKSMNYGGKEYKWLDRKAIEMALEGKIFRIK